MPLVMESHTKTCSRPSSKFVVLAPLDVEEVRYASEPCGALQVASAAPIGAAGRPNRGGAYETGSDGAAGGPPGVRRVPTGPRTARGAAGRSRMGPYINRAPIRDSRAIRRAPSGPVVPKQGSDGSLSFNLLFNLFNAQCLSRALRRLFAASATVWLNVLTIILEKKCQAT